MTMNIDNATIQQISTLCRRVVCECDVPSMRELAFDISLKIEKNNEPFPGRIETRRVFFSSTFAPPFIDIPGHILGEVDSILAKGEVHKIAAIKALRMAINGLGLKEAKDCIDSRKVFPHSHGEFDYIASVLDTPQGSN